MVAGEKSRWRMLFSPAVPGPEKTELFRAAAGGIAGIAACALFAWAVTGQGQLHLFLIAPLGASAVLVFAAPNSPLAQPWSAVTGNSLAAVSGVCAATFLDPSVAPPVAVGSAIAVMMLARALHPPGGAVALLISLDPELVRETGALEVCLNVGIMTAVLVAAGLAYHKLSGRKYPLRSDMGQSGPVNTSRLGLSKDELTDLLARFHQSANLGAVDLGRLLAAAEDEAVHHRIGARTCGEAVTGSLVTLAVGTPFHEIVLAFRQTPLQVLPMVDDNGAVAGMIRQQDVLNQLARCKNLRLFSPPASARDLMRAPEAVMEAQQPLGDVVNAMLRQGLQHILIVDKGELKGMLSRSDVLELALWGEPDRKAA